MSHVFSSPEQLAQIQLVLSRYIRLPFSIETIPGSFMEAVLAHVRGGQVLKTYDFVDVVNRDERVGWQVKSTKATTPVTWKRAKIRDQVALIEASQRSADGVQALGDAIIEFCNAHARASLRDYDLEEIGFARLIVLPNGEVRYFERLLCNRANPDVFDPAAFEWRWSIQKEGRTKEQLSALHGINRATGQKWWAWHGLGENQLHFSGERAWWPAPDSPHAVSFRFPTEADRISLDRLMELLEAI